MLRWTLNDHTVRQAHPLPGLHHGPVHLSILNGTCSSFQTTVLSVRRRPDFLSSGQWEVVTESQGEKHSAVFDGVLVCSGHHILPHTPWEAFPGEACGAPASGAGAVGARRSLHPLGLFWPVLNSTCWGPQAGRRMGLTRRPEPRGSGLQREARPSTGG